MSHVRGVKYEAGAISYLIQDTGGKQWVSGGAADPREIFTYWCSRLTGRSLRFGAGEAPHSEVPSHAVDAEVTLDVEYEPLEIAAPPASDEEQQPEVIVDVSTHVFKQTTEDNERPSPTCPQPLIELAPFRWCGEEESASCAQGERSNTATGNVAPAAKP